MNFKLITKDVFIDALKEMILEFRKEDTCFVGFCGFLESYLGKHVAIEALDELALDYIYPPYLLSSYNPLKKDSRGNYIKYWYGFGDYEIRIKHIQRTLKRFGNK